VTGGPWALAALVCWQLAASGGLPREVRLDQARPWAAGERQVRVLIFDGARSLSLRSVSPLAVAHLRDLRSAGLRSASVPAGAPISLRVWQGRVALRAGALRATGPILRIAPLSPEGATTISAQGGWGRRALYPGALLISPATGGLRVVEETDLETYVAGVVAAELPKDFPPQAMEAQAIAARTYALFHLGDHADQGADLCAHVHCQAYAGSPPEGSPAAEAARQTAGQVLVWNDLLVDALYHSACGGSTAAAWQVRQGKLLPYLRGTSDHDPYGGEADRYCAQRTRSGWRRSYSFQQAQRLVASNLGVVLGDPELSPGRLKSLRVAEREGARVLLLEVMTSSGRYLVRGDSIRWLFGKGRPGAGGGLPSAVFTLTVERDRSRRARAFVFRGRGNGHGIGLCQWGARGRAESGQSAAEILAAYYPGTEIVDLR